jgi:hypothetical protein
VARNSVFPNHGTSSCIDQAGGKMTRTIEALRKAADECEQRAKLSSDRKVKAELYDQTAQWHWLAGQVAELCQKSEELEAV